VKNQPFDLAVDIEESENNSIATNEREDEIEERGNMMGKQPLGNNMQSKSQKNPDSAFKNSTFERKQNLEGGLEETPDEDNYYVQGQ